MIEITGNGMRANIAVTATSEAFRDEIIQVIAKGGALVLRTSKRYAPVSPTQAQINRSLKRKKRSRRIALPGGLEKSIFLDLSPFEASICVPSTAPAAAYARKIHDLKGVKWHNRGIGTRRKGAQADEKFIARAMADSQPAIQKLMDGAYERAFRK